MCASVLKWQWPLIRTNQSLFGTVLVVLFHLEKNSSSKAMLIYLLSAVLLSCAAANHGIENRLQSLEAGFQDLLTENQLLRNKVEKLENKLASHHQYDVDRSKRKYYPINPFIPGGFFYPNSLDWSISSKRGVWLSLSSWFTEIPVLIANSVDPDQTPFCGVWSGSTLSMSLLWNARLKWVKEF